MKKLLLALILLFSVVSLNAQTEVVQDGLKFIVYSDIVYCIGFSTKNPEVKDFVIPEMVNGKYVTHIGDHDNDFRNCTNITGTLTIPSSVKQINNFAFYGCTGITNIKIERNVEELQIGNNAFSGCTGIKGELVIPDRVTAINGRAFENCTGITSVVIGAGVKWIGDRWSTAGRGGTFSGCTGLEKIVCLAETPPYMYYDSNNYNYNYNFPDYNIPIYVPKGSIESYKATNDWKRFTDFYALLPQATGIRISESNVIMKVGSYHYLTATLTPEDADLSMINWESQNPEIATVNNGLVQGIQKGQTIITASSGSVSAVCLVTITEDDLSSGNTDSDCVWNQKGDESALIRKRLFIGKDEEIDMSEHTENLNVSTWEVPENDIVEITRRGILYSYELGETVVRSKDNAGNTIGIFEIFVCPTISIEYNNGLAYQHHVIYNSSPSLYIAAPEGYEITSVRHDGEDVTEAVNANDGYYTPDSPIMDNTVISVKLNSTRDPADLNGDGIVDVSDLNMLIERINNN